MEYNLQNLIENAQKFSKDDFLFFWRTGKAGTVDKGCLSQWYMSDFIIDGQSYCCAEQYMMAMKALLFNDVVVYQEIMKSRSPRKIKELGREIKGFNPEDWNIAKQKIVFEANLAKFTQNAELRQFLLSTNEKILVEASPYDRIWGIGLGETNPKAWSPSDWKGQNLLGFILMKVRKKIIDSTDSQ